MEGKPVGGGGDRPIVDVRGLDLKLDEKGLLIKDSRGTANTAKRRDLVADLRESRKYGPFLERTPQLGVGGRGGPFSLKFEDVESRIHTVAIVNAKVDEAIKMEILGISGNPIHKLIYLVKNVFRDKSSAEDVIKQQIFNVDGLSERVYTLSEAIDERLGGAEERYNRALLTILARHKETQALRDNLGESHQLLLETRDAGLNATDPIEKIKYSHAHRQLRKAIQTEIQKVLLNDKAVTMLKQELPILDNLSSICEAYSFSLKNVYQESRLMRDHLESIMSLYLDMMRARMLNVDLEKEVKTLFEYTRNMTGALKAGQAEMVERANGSSLFEEEYRKTAGDLKTFLSSVETITDNAFQDFERRVDSYKT